MCCSEVVVGQKEGEGVAEGGEYREMKSQYVGSVCWHSY